MKIHGLQKLTLLDYPDKTACTLFTGGCNFRCPFCHNASLVTDPGEPLDMEAVMSYLRKRRGVLDGVCITGGEPLIHRDIADLLSEIKSLGYKVKLDTNGSNTDLLRELVGQGFVDYVAMDIKSSPAGYAAVTGLPDFDISPIDESIRFLIGGNIAYEFRTTAVKGLHTGDDFAAIGRWISGAERYYLQNYTDSGDILGGGQNFLPFSKEELNLFLTQIEPKVKFAALRGVD